MRQRFLTFAIFGLIVVGLAEWNLQTRRLAPLQSLADFWLEFCIGNSGGKVGQPAVTVVRIGEEYEPLALGGESPSPDAPLTRLDYATLFGLIGKLNPKSVAFLPTPTFDEDLVLNQPDVVPLRDTALQLPRLVVAANVTDEPATSDSGTQLDWPEVSATGPTESLLAFTRTVRPPDPHILANGDPAFKTIESARGLLSPETLRVPLVARHGERVVPSLVLAAVARHAGIPLGAVEVDLAADPAVIRLGDRYAVPIEADGTFVVPQKAGLRGEIHSLRSSADGSMTRKHHFTTLTVDELSYTGDKDDEVARRILSDLQGRFRSVGENLVLIGFDRAQDRRIGTEFGEALSETMLIARAVAAIQSGRYIEWWPSWLRWGSVLLIAGIAALLFRLPRGKFAPIWLVTTLVYFGLCVLLFSNSLMWTPPFYALGLFGLMLLIGLILPGDNAESGTSDDEHRGAFAPDAGTRRGSNSPEHAD